MSLMDPCQFCPHHRPLHLELLNYCTDACIYGLGYYYKDFGFSYEAFFSNEQKAIEYMKYLASSLNIQDDEIDKYYNVKKFLLDELKQVEVENG